MLLLFMPKLYYIPGMGTDQRVFQYLAPLIDANWKPCYLTHQSEMNETLSDYGARLAADLEETDEPIAFLGLSLGGPIAMEMARRLPHAAVVLISTYKQQQEEPVLFKMARRVPLYSLVPYAFTRRMVPRLARWGGLLSHKDSQLLRTMFDDSGAAHFAWARHAIVHWSNTWLPDTYLHLNGTHDHIFASANPYATQLIEGGTHSMVITQAATLAEQINPFLAQFEEGFDTQTTH